MERWIAPKDMTTTMLRFDFREGGSYRLRLTYNDSEYRHSKTAADADESEVLFVTLDDQKRTEQEVIFESDDDAFSGVMRMTWTFEPVNDGTFVTVSAEDVPAGIQPEDQETGMKEILESLASFVI